MKDLRLNKTKDVEFFFEKCRKENIYINSNLYINKISENNYGVFTKKNIQKDSRLISIPIDFFLTEKIFYDFLYEKKINFPNTEILESYFSFIPNLDYFEKNHILYIKDNELDNIIKLFSVNSLLKKDIISKFRTFQKLNEIEKYVYLVFRSRSFNSKNESCLIPVMDLVNYRPLSNRLKKNDKEVYFNTNDTLKKNDEFFHTYNYEDEISFYLNYSFRYLDYKIVSIPANYFAFTIPLNLNTSINEFFWNLSKTKNKISNKEKIIFNDVFDTTEFEIEMSQIFPREIYLKILTKVLSGIKNEINLDEVNKIIENGNNCELVVEFAKILKNYHLNLEKLQKKHQQLNQ